jgi:aryl-alcohol dehydrogenase-like predicted oxidoreductase
MSQLALGTVQFGLPYGVSNQSGQVSPPAVKAMLQLASSHAIDMLDTAIAYGSSESRLGQAGVGAFKVVSKLPEVPAGCMDVSAWVQEQVAGSLARLGTNSLHGVLLHKPEQLLGEKGSEIYRALQRLKRLGHMQKIGVSIYAPQQLDALVPLYSFDLVQAPINLIDRRLHTSGWLQRLAFEGVEVHARSAFLQGLLLMPKASIPNYFAQWPEVWAKWHDWLSAHDVSALQACLAYPLSLAGVSRVVVGADSPDQLAQIICAAAQAYITDLPDLQSSDENLVNPACWVLS